jgi:hypothetical protein
MNIVEAYVEQFKYLNVIFTSVDYELLKEIIYNLALDFKAQFVDAYAIMTNIEDIDNERFKELVSGKNPIKFIICPVFPSNFTKIRSSFHVNLSLNEILISEKKINKELINMENKYKNDSIINKYFNVSKYKDNTKKLEDDIFNIILSRINKKLDNGNYEEKSKVDEYEEFKTEKHVSKPYDHYKKEEYLETKDNKFDEQMLEDLSDDSYTSMEDNIIETEDVNMDEYVDPVKDFSDMDSFDVYPQNGGLNKHEIRGIRIIKKEYGISGKRILRKNGK